VSTNAHTFEDELAAQRAIYDALRPFAMQERDRLLRMVQERLAREREPHRIAPRPVLVEEIEVGLPPDAA